MRRHPRFCGLVLVVFALASPSCSSGPEPAGTAAPVEPPKLLPAETFNWTGGKISFSIPPAGWRREGETGGGIKGVRFVKERSVGEAIGLGDFYVLADRNRSSHIQEILARFDSFDEGFGFDRAIRDAYAYTDTPFSPLETEIAEHVNTEISQSTVAWRNHDRPAAKEHLQNALAEASRLRFSFDDVIARVEFTLEGKQNPEWYHMLGRREATIAGERGVIVDYTVKVPERPQTYSAREAYFMHDSHMFVCTFIGLQESLVVFDAILASIQFPE